MIDTFQLMLDRIATLEDRAVDEIGPSMPEGSRILECDRRIVLAIGWLHLSRQIVDPADSILLAKAHTHLLRAQELVREAVTE